MTTIEDFKFLKRGAMKLGEDGEYARPALSWIHRGEIDSKPVLWSADGFRMHISWKCNDYTPERIALDAANPNYTKVPALQPLVDASDGECVWRVESKAFRKHLRQMEYGTTLVSRNGESALTDGNTLRFVDDCVTTSDSVDVTLDPNFLLDALKGWDSTAYIVVKHSMSPVRVGVWGQRCAILMPMTRPSDLDAARPIFVKLQRLVQPEQAALHDMPFARLEMSAREVIAS